MKTAELLPCPTCPWRVNRDATTIPNYVHEKACNLLNTVGEGDAFRNIMACHGSTQFAPQACRGYLARAGWSNINVRIFLSEGALPSPDAVMDACEAAGVELETDYPSVLRKLACSVGEEE